MLAKELTENQKDVFVNSFYSHWEFQEDDAESKLPWGCPWLNRHDEYLRGETIEEMAGNYYYRVRDDIWLEHEMSLEYTGS